MNKNKFKSNEWSIIICTIILITIGLFALYSASKSSDLEDLKKQIMWLAISIPVLFVSIIINYNFLSRISIVFNRNSFNPTKRNCQNSIYTFSSEYNVKNIKRRNQ